MDLSVLTGQFGAYPIVIGAVVAVTEFIKTYVPRINGGLTIIVAAVLGGVAGLFHINGIDVTTGIFLGLAAVGVHTIATAAGAGTTTTPTK